MSFILGNRAKSSLFLMIVLPPLIAFPQNWVDRTRVAFTLLLTKRKIHPGSLLNMFSSLPLLLVVPVVPGVVVPVVVGVVVSTLVVDVKVLVPKKSWWDTPPLPT